MPVEFASLNATALGALPRDRTAFFFPVGPLEPHGPHLPVGLDLQEAERVCRELARRLEETHDGWRAVLMPAAPLGIDSNSASGIRVTVRAHVLRDWLVDACRALNDRGFRYFVCYSGHLGPRQLTAIEEVQGLITGIRHRTFRRSTRPVFVSAASLLVDRGTALKAPLVMEPEEHGGGADTSLALHLGGDAAVAQVYRALPRQDKGGAGIAWRLRQAASGNPAHYWGDPASASAAAGEKALRERVDRIAAELLPVLVSGAKASRFRTAYRLFPPNRSFFKAWMIFHAALVLMVLWMMMYFAAITER